MICASEILTAPCFGHHIQYYDWFLTSHEEVEIFVPRPLPLYLLRMANVLLETVHFHMAPEQKSLWPDPILGCTIYSTRECHFELGSGAPNPLDKNLLRVHKPGLTVQDR